MQASVPSLHWVRRSCAQWHDRANCPNSTSRCKVDDRPSFCDLGLRKTAEITNKDLAYVWVNLDGHKASWLEDALMINRGMIPPSRPQSICLKAGQSTLPEVGSLFHSVLRTAEGALIGFLWVKKSPRRVPRARKSKAPKVFTDGAEMSLRSIAISVP